MSTHNLILVTSPPGCGKTTLAKKLARGLRQCVYLDKDTLIPLSKKIFEVANEEYNRSSEFFEKNIRDLEYQVILDLAFEAIEYDSHVIINAPFAREIRDPEYIDDLRARLAQIDGALQVIWIACSKDTARQRMIERNSDRDTWKIQHWDEYVAMQNFNPPDIEGLLTYCNDTDEEAQESFAHLVDHLQSCCVRA